MKVLYSLQWNNKGEGFTPDAQIAAFAVEWNGGLAEHRGLYLGEMDGTEYHMEAAITGCAGFGMQPITDAEAEAFANDGTLPATSWERLRAAELLIEILGDN